MYDIIFIGNNVTAFSQLQKRFPLAKRVPITTSVLDSFNIAKKKSFTKMFWVVWDDVEILPSFNFDLKVPSWDEKYIHTFLNDKKRDGVILVPRSEEVTGKELTCRFFINKKEMDVQASTPSQYDKFNISSYEDYLNAVEKSTTDLFWVIFDDLIIKEDFDFSLYYSHHDQYARKMNHVFLNGEHYDGVILASKHREISKKEFDHRFLVEKDELDIVASTPKPFDKFYINSYDEYLTALTTSSTEMFWIISDDVIVADNFKFDLYFSHHNQYDRKLNHMFCNGKYYDGIILATKQQVISKREFEYKFLTDKKEWNIVASSPRPFDVVFISYFEKFADENFRKLSEHLQPNQRVFRVSGVKGIHQAHKYAAELVSSDMFWVVDADAILEPNFNFEFPQVVSHDTYTKSIVHVWRSRNPINDLEYGYGGVKLLPKKLTMDMDMSKPDMTTSISASFKAIPKVSNVAGFNTDPFTTWRSAFRECVKLASKTIQGQEDQETEDRLDTWCTVGADKEYGEYAIAGAMAGRKYGQENAGNIPALSLINDYDWLKNRFEQTQLTLERFQ